MNTETFDIEPMGEVLKKDLTEQAKYKEIPQEFQHVLDGMNRAQRRKFYKKNRKKFEKYEEEKRMKQFNRIHKEDTSLKSKEEATELASKVLQSCEGFMLFTVQKDKGNQLKYAGNAFIQQDHAAGMPVFINQVLTGRKDQLDGKETN